MHEFLEDPQLDVVWPVLAWALLRHALLLEERDDLGVEEFVWLHDRDGDGNVGLV